MMRTSRVALLFDNNLIVVYQWLVDTVLWVEDVEAYQILFIFITILHMCGIKSIPFVVSLDFSASE